jgi:hypothetical protein
MKYYYFISIALFLSSCRIFPFLYIPNGLNMPLPGNKHETKLNLYTGSQESYGARGSYAIDSHIVAFADGFTLQYRQERPPENFKHTIFDAGAGYYTKIGSHGRFDALIGGGYGTTNSSTRNVLFDFSFSHTKSSDTMEDLHITSNLSRLTLQMDFGLNYQYVEIAMGLRLTELYPNGNYIATYSDTNQVTGRQKIMSLKNNALLIEPGLMLSAGLNNVKVSLEFGFCYRLSGLKVDEYYGDLYFPSFATVGITVNLFNKN